VYELFYPLTQGKEIRIIKSGIEISKYLHQDEKVLLNSVPVVIENLLKEGTDLKHVKAVNMAGEPIGPYVQEHLDRTNIEVRNLYGPTEDTTYSTVFRLRDNEPVLIGKPIANTKVRILSKDGKQQPVGIAGEICLSGAGVTRGYHNRPELTKEKFIKDPYSKDKTQRLYKTGDLGRWTKDGNIEYLGRIDEQVKIRGYRIELGEIESTLQQSGLVSQAVVVARTNKEGNKYLVAYTVSQNATAVGQEAVTFEKEQAINFLKEKLPEYMVPQIWVELEQLPLTPNGKVDKKALPDPDLNTLLSKQYEAPQTQTEEQLATIWQELLGLEKVGVNDNFFELGGHSLLAMRLLTLIEREFQISLTIQAIFQFSTIKEIAQYIELNIKPTQNDDDDTIQMIEI
jgi:acyl-coenzyme A synthetase/AMP-(fatty) acid ligase/acyl carrier protein